MHETDLAARSETAAAAGRVLAERLPTLGQTQALVGLDGFVDEIVAVVDKRTADGYEPVATIAQLAGKFAAAAGKSGNYELVVKQRKIGGNGPIMANALASVGLGVTYVGNLGEPEIDPAFAPLAEKATVVSVGQPGHTDALEFDDGKLMLGKIETLDEVTWDNLIDAIGQDKLVGMLGESTLIGMVNWTMLAGMSEIWVRLLEDVVPALPEGRRHLFIDLADPEKRLDGDIAEALAILGRIQAAESGLEVTLGLNLKEATGIADVLGLPALADPEASVETLAVSIRERLHLECVVVHPRTGASAATADDAATFAGPFVQKPKISTGAGDHFNAGFCVGRVLGLPLEQCLAVGTATSGYYVRNAQSPTGEQLSAFLQDLPDPQLA